MPCNSTGPDGTLAQYKFAEKEHKMKLNHSYTKYVYSNIVEIKVSKTISGKKATQNTLSSSPFNLKHNVP